MEMTIIIKAFLIGVSLLVGLATSMGIVKWKNDHPVEEAVEEAIEKYTGIDIDLTPATSEKDIPEKKAQKE